MKSPRSLGAHSALPSRSGAAYLPCRRPRALLRSSRSFDRSDCDLRQTALSRKLLLTHRGLSGPAILQISSYWKPPAPIFFDIAPDQTWTPHCSIHARPVILPLPETHCAPCCHSAWPTAGLRCIHPLRLDKCRAGRDGAADARLACNTRRHRGLRERPKSQQAASTQMRSQPRQWNAKPFADYFLLAKWSMSPDIWEVFNFQWAWASGYSAGQALASPLVVA